MQGPIQAAYKDAFQSIVLPVFERGCQSMFQQINDSFKQGTQECKAAATPRHRTEHLSCGRGDAEMFWWLCFPSPL